MKRLFGCLVLSAIVLFARGAPARDLTPQLGAFSKIVIPTSANVAGQAGTFYRTRLTILNVTNDTFDVSVILYGGVGQVGIQSITLAGHQARVYENVLQDLFQFGGAGALVFDSHASGRDFIVTAEVFNDKPGCGRFKTVVTGGPILEPSLPGFDSYSLGVIVDANNRTNIGVFNASNQTVNVTIDVLDGAGNIVKTQTSSFPALTWNQFGLTGLTISNGVVRYRVDQAAFIWAVTVSNDSGDGTFFPAADVVQ
ncbi:MAG TPA: hypothetical protein VKF32_03145 [Thermoanaerobaculia bacterium]|nr:hypothetical protein [Thermoanaerobaculia bacterium]